MSLKSILKNYEEAHDMEVEFSKKLYPKHKFYYWIKSVGIIILAVLAIIGALSMAQGAVSDNITIISPIDETITAPEFKITVLLVTNDTPEFVQAHVSGYPWVNLVYDGSNEWVGTINISAVPNGDYKIQALYRVAGSLPVESPKVSITINKPPILPEYGSILVTVLDTLNRPVQGVTIQPGNNLTDSNGNVFVGGQALNTNINFSLTKSSHNSTYFDTIFTNSNRVTRTVTMGRVNGDEREFSVSGYDNMVVGRGNFILVYDSVTGAKVDGASIAVYDGANVKSLPGNTVNGRLFVSIPSESVAGEYLIEVTRAGYKDWSDTFTVWAPAPTPKPSTTPTPSPTSTPVPTVSKKYRPDMCEKLKVCDELTNDQYIERLPALEALNRSQANITTLPPRREESFPWLLAFLFVGGIVIIGAKKYGTGLFGTKKPDEPETVRHDIIAHDPYSHVEQPIIRSSPAAIVKETPPMKETPALQETPEPTGVKPPDPERMPVPAPNEPNVTETEEKPPQQENVIIIKCSKCDWVKKVLAGTYSKDERDKMLADHMKSEHGIRNTKKKAKEGAETI